VLPEPATPEIVVEASPVPAEKAPAGEAPAAAPAAPTASPEPSPVPAPAKAEPPVVESALSGWVVQVGSFSRQENAIALRDKLRARERLAGDFKLKAIVTRYP